MELAVAPGPGPVQAAVAEEAAPAPAVAEEAAPAPAVAEEEAPAPVAVLAAVVAVSAA